MLVLLILAGLCHPISVPASEMGEDNLQVVPSSVMKDLKGLLALVEPGNTNGFVPSSIENVMAFILADNQEIDRYTINKIKGVPSAYYRFPLKTDLKKFLQYCYNTKIPSAIFSPSSIRMASWSGEKGELPPLWRSMDQLETSVMVRRVENIEITPDQFSGAYYQYKMNKALILCRYKGKNLFISVQRQNDVSEPGKKGVVIGKDQDWNYFYSGKKGLGIKGLGWADTYMYDSLTVSFYYQPDPASQILQCAVFSGVKAGWSGINMVKSDHVYKGLIRYAEGFKMVIEHPMLPDPPTLEKLFSQLNEAPISELRPQVKAYLDALGTRYSQNRSAADEISRQITSDTYLNRLSSKEIQSVMALEYIKKIMGKATVADFGVLYSRSSAHPPIDYPD